MCARVPTAVLQTLRGGRFSRPGRGAGHRHDEEGVNLGAATVSRYGKGSRPQTGQATFGNWSRPKG